MLETIVIIMIVAIALSTAYSVGRSRGQAIMLKTLGTGINQGVLKIDKKKLEEELKKMGVK